MMMSLLSLLLIFLIKGSNAWSSWFAESTDEESKNVHEENDLVSPIVNREIQVSVKAHDWPSSPQSLLCEAFAIEGAPFLDSLVSIVLDNDVNELHVDNDAAARKLAVQASSHPKILEWSLLLRSASPHCELMRSLSPNSEEDAVAVVDDTLILSMTDMETVDWLALTEKLPDAPNATFVLPDEPILGDGKSTNHLVVLYANLGTSVFANLYNRLKHSGVQFVVRHLGQADAKPTLLQGYGVRLDIRNVEYKVFDDRSEGSTAESDSLLINATTASSPGRFLSGVNLAKLDIDKEAQSALWKLHDRQPTVPPVWQRRRLPLQAATVISQSKDPLYTMQAIIQDLPSTASTLVHVPVDDAVAQAAEKLDRKEFQSGLLYVNGKVVAYFDRPSFNVFEVVDQIRKEQLTVDKISQQFNDQPREFVKDLFQAWMAGKGQASSSMTDVRINVGKGWRKAILYLNDVEKDAQYASWTRSVRQAVMSLQYGMPPAVRRNLFTTLAVFDPLESLSNPGLELGFQLVQSSYPVRIGLLIVSRIDVLECTKWLKSQKGLSEEDGCPVGSILPPQTSLGDLKKIPATTQAIHRIFTEFAVEESFGQGLVVAYAEYFVSTMSELSSPTMFDLIEMHGNVLEGLRIGSDGKEEAFDMLKGKENKNYKYGKALRFAAEKGLTPGLSFLNGKPFQDDQAFMTEQRFVFNMIVKGDITDTSPRSVYAHLLATGTVFQKLHPLLASGNGDKVAYRSAPSAILKAALLSPSDDFLSDGSAYYVVDAALDYNTQAGLDATLSVLSTLGNYHVSPEETSVVQFRLLPSSLEAAQSVLCPLLMNGSLLGASKIEEFLKTVALPIELSDLPDILDRMQVSGETKKIIEEDTSCSTLEDFVETLGFSRAVMANGRVFEIETSFESDDLDLLLSLEGDKAKVATELVRGHYDFKDSLHGLLVSRTAEFLSQGDSKRKLFEHTDSPLEFKWNDNSVHDALQVQITAVIDPVSEGAQRAAPLLRAIRDQLELPLHVILTPDAILDDSAKIPITSYYRFVINGEEAVFSNLPASHVLTLRVDVPEPWNVQQSHAVQDTDNLRCDVLSGCSDEAASNPGANTAPLHEQVQVTRVEVGLKNLLVFGQCYETSKSTPPNGLQLNLIKAKDWPSDVPAQLPVGEVEVSADGSLSEERQLETRQNVPIYSDTLVMKNVGYWQVPANPGIWKLSIAAGSKGEDIFEMVDGSAKKGRIVVENDEAHSAKTIVLKSFIDNGELLLVRRKPGYETSSIFHEETTDSSPDDEDVINVFSLATGNLYERFLKIMMLSVTKRTSSKVKFWLFENFLSPTFKSSARAMAKRIGCEVEFVTYKWPEWLRGQSEKQRIIWGYKILFLDVLFPLSVKKIIYVDADQVVRGDLKELWDMDLQGKAYGYTPFCDSRETTLGYQFWRDGFWKNHLQGRPYHISALYVVDLDRFRRTLVGDQLRSIYQQLSADPNSLANLDQDLPNYAQHQVPIFSLPQEWLWCESWCSDETKSTAKTIDLCNNPLHKEPKVSMAKRIISGALFNESWVELDEEVERYEREYYLEAKQTHIIP